MRDPKERLQDILEAIAAIERHRVQTKTEFDSNELLQAWFVRHLQIIGEAVRNLPDAVRNLAPEIPWTKMIGMRNVLVHGYFEIDKEVVWDTVCQDIRLLKSQIENLLRKLEESS